MNILIITVIYFEKKIVFTLSQEDFKIKKLCGVVKAQFRAFHNTYCSMFFKLHKVLYGRL